MDLHVTSQDVGHAALESYSRVLESLAYTVLSRIEDVLYADFVAQNPSQASCKGNHLKEGTPITVLPSSKDEGDRGMDRSNSMTLSDLLTWSMDQGENEAKKELSEELTKEAEGKHSHKLNIVFKRPTYLDNLGGSRSPTSRH